jgi:hypothetical protein
MVVMVKPLTVDHVNNRNKRNERNNQMAPATRYAVATGLNLQHSAAAVINVDQPWNPAVLAQRIARVHRLGQTRPVRVINLVAKDSIESRILGLLGSKRSLAAGILDAGADTVDLGGNRMKRFMTDVEAATTDSPAAAFVTDSATDSTMTNADRATSNDSPPTAARTLAAKSISKRTKPAKTPTLTASSVAARLAELVGVHADALTVSMAANGQATITLTPELLAKLGLKI